MIAEMMTARIERRGFVRLARFMDLFCGAAPAFDQRVKAPGATTFRRHVEKDEAEQNSRRPSVLHRPATSRPKVKLPISDGHRSGEHERHGSRAKAKQDQYAAKEFKDPADSGLAHQVHLRATGHAAEPAEENHAARLNEQKSADYPKQKISDFFGLIHRVLSNLTVSEARP